MNPVNVIAGRMVPLDRADVDTDQIMPKEHLKRIERTGFGELLFSDWRSEADFVLNDPRYEGANVLLAGANFGCGSSREHAPWGLQQFGFEAIIAPSFADIFRNNCAKVGLLTVALPAEEVRQLIAAATEDPETPIRIDLPEQQVVTGVLHTAFDVDPFTKHLLLHGLDDIGMTLQHATDVDAFEARRPAYMPTTRAPVG